MVNHTYTSLINVCYRYYVNLGAAALDPTAPLHSTWTKPAQYSRLLRSTDAY